MDTREELKDWRGTTTKTAPAVRLDTTSRAPYTIPMASPVRHRGKYCFRRPELGGGAAKASIKFQVKGRYLGEMPLRQILTYQYLKKIRFL
jgi:hypothetical protein